MDEILHANIFFVIASTATVIFCILVSVILYHVLKIVRSLRKIIERIEAGSEAIAEDVAHVRELVASGGIVSRVMQFVMGARPRRTQRRTRAEKK